MTEQAHADTSSRSSRWPALASLPGAALAVLPAVTCPACLAAYVALLTSLGLGFLANEVVLLPLVIGFLVLGIATTAWSSRSHGHRTPLVLDVVGTLAVLIGRVF